MDLYDTTAQGERSERDDVARRGSATLGIEDSYPSLHVLNQWHAKQVQLATCDIFSKTTNGFFFY